MLVGGIHQVHEPGLLIWISIQKNILPIEGKSSILQTRDSVLLYSNHRSLWLTDPDTKETVVFNLCSLSLIVKLPSVSFKSNLRELYSWPCLDCHGFSKEESKWEDNILCFFVCKLIAICRLYLPLPSFGVHIMSGGPSWEVQGQIEFSTALWK